MGGLPNEFIPIPTYPKQRGRQMATTDSAHHVVSSSGLITTVVMTLFQLLSACDCNSLCACVLFCVQSSRVTAKVELSFTEHSHVIGKGGHNIKKVMQETSCHVHFPDSNRSNNPTEKSNQVGSTPKCYIKRC